MTIGAGFQCSNGFVLCADRLMAHGKATEFGSFAHYEKKLFGTESFHFAAALCGSGDGLLIKAAADDFLKKFIEQADEQEEEGRMPNTTAMLEAVLNRLADRTGDISEMSLLAMAAMRNTHPHFIRSDGLVVQDAKPVEVLGIGDMSLTRFLIDQIHRSDMDLYEAAALGILVVYGAKKYCPQYCGGQTDVYVVPSDYLLDALPIPEERVNAVESLLSVKMQGDLSALIAAAGRALKEP